MTITINDNQSHQSHKQSQSITNSTNQTTAITTHPRVNNFVTSITPLQVQATDESSSPRVHESKTESIPLEPISSSDYSNSLPSIIPPIRMSTAIQSTQDSISVSSTPFLELDDMSETGDDDKYPPNQWCIKPTQIIGVQEETPVCFSSDSKYVAYVSGNKSIYILEDSILDDGRRLFVVKKTLPGHTEIVRDMKFHPQKPLLVSVSGEGIFVWNYEDGSLVKTINESTERDAHESQVECVDFVCQGRLMVTGSKDLSIRVWNVESDFAFVEALLGHKATILCLAACDEINMLASSGRDSTIKLWDLSNVAEALDSEEGLIDDSLKIVNESNIDGHRGDITTLTWKANGQVLLSGARDNEIKMFSIPNGMELRSIKDHLGDIRKLVFLDDEKMMYTASADKFVKLWELLPFEEIVSNEFDFTNPPETIDFLSTPASIAVMELSQDQDKKLMSLPAHEDDIFHMAVSPNQQTMVTSSTWNCIRIWNIADPRVPQLIQEFVGHKGPVKSCKFVHEDAHLLTGSEDFQVCFFQQKSGRRIAKFNFGGSVIAIDAHPNQKMVFAGGSDYDVKAYSLDNTTPELFKKVAVFQGHCGRVEALAVSPRGNVMATAAHDFNLIMWNIKERYSFEEGTENPVYEEPSNIYDAHTGHIMSLRFNESGDMLASVGADHRIIVWSVNKSGKLSQSWTMEGAHDSVISACCWGKGNTKDLLITCSWDNKIKVWNPTQKKNKNALSILKGHTARITDLDTTDDGSLLLSAGSDCTLRCWDLSDFSCLLEYMVHSSDGAINCVSAGQDFCASGSDNGMIRIWPLPTEAHANGDFFVNQKPSTETKLVGDETSSANWDQKKAKVVEPEEVEVEGDE
eukprot:TRINITY_DN1790_c0_g1_i4.p1 TRINITY_DN1790_c0_g1~~TRINITY_DN1790_c0_g1_i4.p1  ORF type:complete len:860 (-),score=292.11 TRINITY_DN1790_c0_g1_i4:449-3028(-)